MEERLHAIGEVAQLSGVPVKTIRYYSDSGLLPPAQITASRYRLYTTTDIWRLQTIRMLRQMGFGLEDIRALLAGDLSVTTAIDWQVEALDEQIQRLSRVRAVLQQARLEMHDTRASLRYLYDVSLALGKDSAERSRFLAEHLRVLVMRANLPEQWREQLLEHFSWELPAEFTPEQAAAWTEIVAIINDPAFAEEALRYNHVFSPQQDSLVDLSWYNEQTLRILQNVQALALEGKDEEHLEVQQRVDEWVTVLATIANRSVTDEFLGELLQLASERQQGQERVERFWELLTFLAGYEKPPSYHEALSLLGRGIRFYVARRERSL